MVLCSTVFGRTELNTKMFKTRIHEYDTDTEKLENEYIFRFIRYCILIVVAVVRFSTCSMSIIADMKRAEHPTKKTDGKLLDSWMIRPCGIYQVEYQLCTSLKSRFYQYYIHGELEDCSDWKRDQKNCELFVTRADIGAGQKVIDNEKRRKANRLAAHYGNDVWEHRTDSPPKNWNSPLPHHILDKHRDSYLQKIEEEKISEKMGRTKASSFCTFM